MPDFIISTGAGVGVAPCYLGKIFFGSKVIWVDTACRRGISLSGRFVKPIADLFLKGDI